MFNVTSFWSEQNEWTKGRRRCSWSWRWWSDIAEAEGEDEDEDGDYNENEKVGNIADNYKRVCLYLNCPLTVLYFSGDCNIYFKMKTALV